MPEPRKHVFVSDDHALVNKNCRKHPHHVSTFGCSQSSDSSKIWMYMAIFLEPNNIKDAQHTARIFNAYTWAPSAPWSPAMPGSPGSPWNKEKGKPKSYKAENSSCFLITGWIIYVRTLEQLYKVLPNKYLKTWIVDVLYPPMVLGAPLGLSFQHDPKTYDVLLSSHLLIINDYFNCV